MTPRERAKEVLHKIMGGMYSGDDNNYALGHIEQAITAAVEEEREACIKIMEEEARKHSAYSGGLEIFGVNQEGMTALKMIQAIHARSEISEEVKR